MDSTKVLQTVAIVTETYDPEINGVATTLKKLVDGLLSRGIDVQLIKPKRKEDANATPVDGLRVYAVLGLPILGYPELKFGLPSPRYLRRLWKRNKPDALYIATEGPLGRSALKAAEKLGIPMVSGFHTNFHQYSEHYKVGFIRDWILNYLRKFHNRTASTLIATQDLATVLGESGIENMKVMGRGVDCQLFDPAKRQSTLREEWGVSADDLVLMYCGRVAAEKNIEFAMQAYESVRSVQPNTKCVVVGDGPELARLKQQHPDVIYAGMKRGEELAQFYASADVFVFPSETETFGNVTTEAMASGLAVAVYDYAAARRHIQNGDNGIKVATGDTQAYVEALVSLCESPEAIERIRLNAREEALLTSWEAVVDRFEQAMIEATELNGEDYASENRTVVSTN